jgi:DNA polymerase III epsilon subunit-like protein
MHYITLDLEWNQAYAQKALAVQRQLSCRLRGEVIQIGAVKLDEKMQPIGSYQIIVKPKYFKKLHRHVSELTGITQDQMDMGTPLPIAEAGFRKWCGTDFAFLTWGPDDIPMLKENLHVHGIDGSWLARTYDLQIIFNRQTDGLNKQRSLEYAMEYFEIPQRLPAHDALNDAYFTALVAEKLDVKAGIAAYDQDKDPNDLETSVIGDADAGADGYVTISEMLDDEAISAPVCPLCKAALTRNGKPLHTKGQKYTYLYNCEKDGDMFLTLKLYRNFNDTWRAKRTLTRASDDKLESYCQGLERAAGARKAAVKHRRRPRKKPAADQQPARKQPETA